MRFHIDNKVIDTTTGMVIDSEGETSIRAKTLQVLTYLIEHKSHIVDKQSILEHVWDDVIVQDQVLTQSIKEIRDLLGANVIKTYSRKGYQWVAPLKLKTNDEKNTNQRVALAFFQKHYILCVGLFGVIVFIFSFMVLQLSQNRPSLKVAILPVKNDIKDSIHNWVPLRGQEHLSQGLQSTSQLNIIDIDYVLYAIEKLTKLQYQNYRTGALYPLKEKLDADLVVYTRITGFPEDFQLHYRLQTPYGLEQGIEFSSSVVGAFDQLIEKIATRFDSYQPRPVNYESQFSNAAFARGIALYLEQNYQMAKPMLQSAINTDSELLAARRYLAASYANTNEVQKAIELLQTNIDLANQLDRQDRELLRAYLMIGYLQINWPNLVNRANELLSAEQYIEKAKQLAEQLNDQLFIAYSHEELGKVKRLQGDYISSAAYLKNALQYHKRFQGDYGQTAALIELAKVSNAQQQDHLTQQYLTKAYEIASSSEATANLIWVLLAKADIAKSKMNSIAATEFATKAKQMALQSDDQILIARVNAWFSDEQVYTVN